MPRKRTPRDADRYTTATRAAQFLERIAKDIRKNDGDHLVKVNVDIFRWYGDEGAPVTAIKEVYPE